MAINLAKKYSDKIASYFTLKSVVDGNTNNDYAFTGASTIQIYTPITQPLGNYSRSGLNRYGTPSEMQDVTQELTLARDRAFSIIIDKGNNSEQMSVKDAGKMLALELDEQVIPEMDKYALRKFIDHAGALKKLAAAPAKETIVALLSDALVALSNKNVPKNGRVIYIGWTYFGILRSASEFIGNDALGRQALEKGSLGTFMGADVIPVPDDYLKKSSVQAYFLITHKNSVLQPKTIQDYFVKTNPPGINGALLEGRFRYDAFILGAKADGVYAAVAAESQLDAPVNTYNSGDKTMTVSATGANLIKYTLDGTDPRYSATALSVSGTSATVALSSYSGTSVTVKSVAYSDTLFTSGVTTTTQAIA